MSNLAINTVQQDIVINAIENKTLNASNLNFYTLRNLAGIDSNKHAELDHGRLTIQRQDLLNQYLFSYGLMVQRQWHHVAPNIVEHIAEILFAYDDQKIHLYDYGCGQGLAVLLLLETISGLDEYIEQTTLIEPSEIALARTKSLIECKFPHVQAHTISDQLDDVEAEALNIDTHKVNVHLFSNILDIESFDQVKLFNKILGNGGTHYFIAVSSDRNFKGGTLRLKMIFDALITLGANKPLDVSVSHTQFEYFKDEKDMNHVYFCLKVEMN